MRCFRETRRCLIWRARTRAAIPGTAWTVCYGPTATAVWFEYCGDNRQVAVQIGSQVVDLPPSDLSKAFSVFGTRSPMQMPLARFCSRRFQSAACNTFQIAVRIPCVFEPGNFRRLAKYPEESEGERW